MWKRTVAGVLWLSWSVSPLVAQKLELGYRDGKRHLLSRGVEEELPTPDVVTLKDGRRIEVYFLQEYREKVVFFLQEDERFWVRHVIPRGEIQGVERRTYLAQDPLAPLSITRAVKQPVRKAEILAGKFVGRQGRHTSWRMTFHSENDKLEAFAEDATEFGRFTALSYSRQEVGEELHAHRTRAFGRYFLYRPGSVNNTDWLLVFTDVLQNETDLLPSKALETRVIPYEAFIVDFSPKRDSFGLVWANISKSAWSAPTQVSFRRREASPGEPNPVLGPSPGRHLRARPADATRKSRLAAPVSRQRLASRPRRWGSGWGRPLTYWNPPRHR